MKKISKIILLFTIVFILSACGKSKDETVKEFNEEIIKYLELLESAPIESYYENALNENQSIDDYGELIKLNNELIKQFKKIEKISKNKEYLDKKFNEFQKLHLDLVVSILDANKINRFEENVLWNDEFRKLFLSLQEIDKFANKYKYNIVVDDYSYFYMESKLDDIKNKKYDKSKNEEVVKAYLNDFFASLYILKFDKFVHKTTYTDSDLVMLELAKNQRDFYRDKVNEMANQSNEHIIDEIASEYGGRTSNFVYTIEEIIKNDGYADGFDFEFSFERLEGLSDMYDLDFSIEENKIIKKKQSITN